MKHLISCLFFVLCSFLSGCYNPYGRDCPVEVSVVSTALNTFVKSPCDEVADIKIFETSQYDKIVWEIDVLLPISKTNLIVQAGKVPDGFVQKYPTPPGEFVPVKGRTYMMVIYHKNFHIPPHRVFWCGQ